MVDFVESRVTAIHWSRNKALLQSYRHGRPRLAEKGLSRELTPSLTF
jgi:hypothetical protein